MIRKEFVVTEKQLSLIKGISKKYGMSQNEVLRRFIDKTIGDKPTKKIEKEILNLKIKEVDSNE